LAVLRITLALLAVVEPVLLVVLVDRPLRGGPVDARHEVVLARGHEVLVLLGRLRLGLAPAGNRLEGGRGVGELRDALANRGEVGVGLGAARDREINRARLIPVHPDRADRVVEQPALPGPAARQRRRGPARPPPTKASWPEVEAAASAALRQSESRPSSTGCFDRLRRVASAPPGS